MHLVLLELELIFHRTTAQSTTTSCRADCKYQSSSCSFCALTLLVGRQEGHLACKKTEWWGAGVVICLQRGADLHVAQLMPLLLTVSCFSKIQIGFTFLVPAHLGSPGQKAVKCVCVCACVTCRTGCDGMGKCCKKKTITG